MSNKDLISSDSTRIWGISFSRTRRFLKWKWLSLGFSFLFLAAGTVKLIVQGGFKMGIDFIGGTRIEVSIANAKGVDDVRNVFSKKGIDSEVTTVSSGTNMNYLITIAGKQGAGTSQSDSIESMLIKKFGKNNVIIRGSELIGSRMGNSFALRSLQLMLIVTVMILLYVAVRFDFLYGAGAIVALFHDVLVMLASVVLLNVRMDMTILAAVLTILGYSINDTIVVFDRVRENHKINPDEDYEYTMDKSITQSLSRTIITSLTTLIVAGAIYFLGGRVLKNFGLLMMIGIISGTYSSIFIASPITYILRQALGKNKEGKKKKS